KRTQEAIGEQTGGESREDDNGKRKGQGSVQIRGDLVAEEECRNTHAYVAEGAVSNLERQHDFVHPGGTVDHAELLQQSGMEKILKQHSRRHHLADFPWIVVNHNLAP